MSLPIFRDHAVATLAAGVFEHHDRSRFESIACSLGRDDGAQCEHASPARSGTHRCEKQE